jgi:hypothetical protein
MIIDSRVISLSSLQPLTETQVGNRQHKKRYGNAYPKQILLEELFGRALCRGGDAKKVVLACSVLGRGKMLRTWPLQLAPVQHWLRSN